MLHRTGILLALLVSTLFFPLASVAIEYADASQSRVEELWRQEPDRIVGKVTDVLEASGYTYAEVDTGDGRVWAAAGTTALNVGETVAFTTEMPMKNFHSNSLNRDFPVIYFVNRFITSDAGRAGAAAAAQMTSPHGSIKADAGAVEGIDKVEGGSTIAELYANKQMLNGKTIRVRGQVTKYNAKVMGKNWLHIRDSSTPDDLTITTSSTAAIDDVVVIEGKLTLDKDFGYGYVYPLIVEDAAVTKE